MDGVAAGTAVAAGTTPGARGRARERPYQQPAPPAGARHECRSAGHAGVSAGSDALSPAIPPRPSSTTVGSCTAACDAARGACAGALDGGTGRGVAPVWDSLEEFTRSTAAATAVRRPAGQGAGGTPRDAPTGCAGVRGASADALALDGAAASVRPLAVDVAAAACGPSAEQFVAAEWRGTPPSPPQLAPPTSAHGALRLAQPPLPPGYAPAHAPAHGSSAPPPVPLPPAPAGAPAVLPSGRVLRVRVLGTWGDPHYVGLTGLDLFSDDGSLIAPSEVELAAVRAEHGGGAGMDARAAGGLSGADPRVCRNVFDGHNRTADDMHMWLAPYTPGCAHVIELRLERPVTLAMVRVWNYNKSRTHSFRGARALELRLDGALIFAGEVNKAPGNAQDATAAAEVILFTTDENILAAVEANDPTAQQAAHLALIAHGEPSGEGSADERPRTASGRRSAPGADGPPPRTPPGAAEPLRPSASQVPAELFTTARPQTTVGQRQPPPTPPAPGAAGMRGGFALGVHRAVLEDVVSAGGAGANGELAAPNAEHADANVDGLGALGSDGDGDGDGAVRSDYVLPRHPVGRVLELRLQSTWGDRHYIGLNGLEVWVLPADDAHGDEQHAHGVRADGGDDRTGGGGAVTAATAAVTAATAAADGAHAGARGARRRAAGRPVRLRLPPSAVTAEPASINVLPGMRDDPRTVDKLVDGAHTTRDDRHMWLAPWTAGEGVSVRIDLGPTPRALAMLKVWNYGKTPSRGAKQLEVLLDETLLFAGYARRAPERAAGGVDGDEVRARWAMGDGRCAVCESSVKMSPVLCPVLRSTRARCAMRRVRG